MEATELFCDGFQEVLASGLREVGVQGHAFLSDFVRPDFCEPWAAELAGGAYRPFRSTQAAFEAFGIVPGITRGFPLSLELMRTLPEIVHQCGSELFATWQPNAASVQRYRSPGDGVKRHRDNLTDAVLSMVFTALGGAPFFIHDVSGKPDVVAEFTTAPGALVLLCGTNQLFVGDPRPYHSVAGPHGGDRISFGVRMDQTLF